MTLTDRQLSFGMKIPACLCRVLLLFPPVMLLPSIFLIASDRPVSVTCLAAMVIAMGCGAVLGRFFSRSSSIFARISRPLCALATGFLATLLPLPLLLLRLYLGGACAVCLWIGFNCLRRHYTEILSDKVTVTLVVFYSITAAALCVVRALSQTPVDLPLLTGLFLAGISCSGIVRNQSNLDFLMERRHHRPEDLPPKIRRYNLLLTFFCFSIVLICLLLRNPIAAVLRFLAKLLKQLVLFCLWLIDWILSRFLTFSATGESAPSAPPISLGAGENSAPFQFPWAALLVAAAALLFFRYRKEIFRTLNRLLQFFARLIRRLFSLPKAAAPIADSIYYSDSMEKIDKTEQKKKTGCFSFRLWKKELLTFSRMDNDAAKYRFGYRLLLHWLRSHQEDLTRSDTIHEIYDKTADILSGSDYAASLQSYERVRYGEMPPTQEEINCLVQLLHTADQQRPRRQG